MDRGRRSKMIKNDEQDRCEWVNVSSGTSSPEQTQTKGHKMTVVQCSTYAVDTQLQKPDHYCISEKEMQLF